MGVEARTSLGRSPRQITMADDLSIRKHLMKDRQQIGQPLRLSRRAGVAGLSVLVQSAFVADTDGTVVVRHGISTDLQQHPVLRHRSVAADIEMHYHTAVFASGSRQRYWDELIDSYFDDILDHVEINGVGVPTLPPTLNAIYLFVHIYHDFLKEGIALRQFIDWMMFFEAKHKEIVLPELTAKLDKLGLLSAFKAFGAVLTEVLGMDAACLPYSLTESDKRYVDKIMTIVLRYEE